MKIRAARRSQDEHVVLQMEPRNSTLPPISVPEVNLKKILVPIDFSAQSRKAMQYGLSFAKQFNAEVLLLHVVELTPLPAPPLMVVQDEATQAGVHESTAKELAAWRDEISSQAAVKASVRNGISPHAEIVNAATEGNMDLIILGTQGRAGLAHLLIGSTAERVVRHAPCPVMVVRKREHDFVSNPEGKPASEVK
jgi:nucleotide-binding universal stress UspA family protein